MNRLYYFICVKYEMTVVVELDVWKVANEMTRRVMIWINKWLLVLLDELKRLTPEDTRNMLWSYEVEHAKIEWDIIVWTIKNKADYAIYVEYWVGWLQFNYHKPKWNVFYRWIGNRTFARAVDNTRDRIMQIVLSELNR